MQLPRERQGQHEPARSARQLQLFVFLIERKVSNFLARRAPVPVQTPNPNVLQFGKTVPISLGYGCGPAADRPTCSGRVPLPQRRSIRAAKNPRLPCRPQLAEATAFPIPTRPGKGSTRAASAIPAAYGLAAPDRTSPRAAPPFRSLRPLRPRGLARRMIQSAPFAPGGR